MDEGAAEKERQPIMSNLLQHVSKDDISTVFKELNLQEEKDSLRGSNPYVLADLEHLTEHHVEEKAKQVFWGAMLFDRVLREKAELKGVILPKLTEQFVEDYAEQKDNAAEENRIEAVHYRNLSDEEEIEREFRRSNIAKFRNFEPEFSGIVEGEFGAQPNWAPEEDNRYIGFIYEYLLFRAGLSDPKNFQRTR